MSMSITTHRRVPKTFYAILKSVTFSIGKIWSIISLFRRFFWKSAWSPVVHYDIKGDDRYKKTLNVISQWRKELPPCTIAQLPSHDDDDDLTQLCVVVPSSSMPSHQPSSLTQQPPEHPPHFKTSNPLIKPPYSFPHPSSTLFFSILHISLLLQVQVYLCPCSSSPNFDAVVNYR